MTHNRKSKDYLFVKTKTNDKVSLLHESILWQYEMNTKNYECSHLEIQTVFGPFWTTQLNDLFLHDVQYNRFGFLLWKNVVRIRFFLWYESGFQIIWMGFLKSRIVSAQSWPNDSRNLGVFLKRKKSQRMTVEWWTMEIALSIVYLSVSRYLSIFGYCSQSGLEALWCLRPHILKKSNYVCYLNFALKINRLQQRNFCEFLELQCGFHFPPKQLLFRFKTIRNAKVNVASWNI